MPHRRVRLNATHADHETEDLLAQITALVPGMVYQVVVNPDGSSYYTFVSAGVRELCGVEPEAVLANPQILRDQRHPDDRVEVEALLDRANREVTSLSHEFRIVVPSGAVKWVSIRSSAIAREGQGSIRNGVMFDITAERVAAQAMRDNEERWRLALESTGDGVWDWDIASGREYCSQGLLRMYGYSPEEMRNAIEDLDQRTHPDDTAQMAADREAHFKGETPYYRNEHRVLCKNGEWKWILSRGMVVSRDAQGRPLRMIGTHTDISERKKAEALIWAQAHYDPLTGLPNRRLLRERLQATLQAHAQKGQALAILFIDLDHFKEVNDTLGHDHGDLLLTQAAQRIQACLGPADIVARMGGDEFTVVLGELPCSTAVSPAAPDSQALAQQLIPRLQALLDTLARAFDLRGEHVFVSASIGVAMFPEDASQVEDLFKHADQALYVAKGAGRNRYSFFTPALQEAAQLRARLTQDLRQALPQQQFAVVYQPIVTLATGEVHKAEALLRWQHPKRGAVSPAVFIPIAETSGQVLAIGDWVFAQAAQQVATWRRRLAPGFQISVNSSPIEFQQERDFLQACKSVLEPLKLAGNAIAVEITEGVLMDTSEQVSAHLQALRAAGLTLSLDDFGTGYSSLTYLQKLSLDVLKIDQSFVRNLHPGSTELTLCRAIIAMAHALGMKVVAEGVETAEQRALLLDAGCDYGQGYLFARPMPADQFEDWMRSR